MYGMKTGAVILFPALVLVLVGCSEDEPAPSQPIDPGFTTSAREDFRAVTPGAPAPVESPASLSADPNDPFGGARSRLPRYDGELTGSNEVRIKNPNDFHVRVGLLSEGKGKHFVVSGNGEESVRVPNGSYEIFFQYSNDPEYLYQGDDFTLNNNGVEIHIVKVVDGNYNIRKVQ